MVITSPPYWSLRDYGLDPVLWDNNPDCDHEWIYLIKRPPGGKPSSRTLVGSNKNVFINMRDHNVVSYYCKKCGAWKGQLGLEPTPEMYVKHLCDIFDEIKRVLREDGTLWVNIGDAFKSKGSARTWAFTLDGKRMEDEDCNVVNLNIRNKSLVGLPEMFVLEMQKRGWIRRNTIIWKKGNAIPCSVKDRFTVDFEYMYLFVKSESYYFEQQFEPFSDITEVKYRIQLRKNKEYNCKEPYKYNMPYKHNKARLVSQESPNRMWEDNESLEAQLARGRNKRCVWEINTRPFKDAHFAVFPPDLLEIPIKAGCPEYICVKCGKPAKKIFDSSRRINTRPGKDVLKGKSGTDENPNKSLHRSDLARYRQIILYEDAGYERCDCNAGFQPGIVLDPFMGSGTTAIVAEKLNRLWVGIEIKKEYIDIAKKRILNERKR